MAGRILVIRGGAIGDFILTMPAIRLLRENFTSSSVEILGYPSIAALALDNHHATAVHSIEYGSLAGFFARNAALNGDLVRFFAGFQQIISYLYDPDGLFSANLRQAGVKNLLCGPGKLHDQAHAASQLAHPLEQLALYLDQPAAMFFPTADDRRDADLFLSRVGQPFVAIHPGSGSRQKNWTLPNWSRIIRRLLDARRNVVLLGGEADGAALDLLEAQFGVLTARDLPLRTVGTVLGYAQLYLGHDSGISHLAAAAGTRCLLLFGPTDPEIWAPRNPRVTILQSPTDFMANLLPDLVWQQIERFSQDSGESWSAVNCATSRR